MKDAVILLLCAVALAQGFNQSPDRQTRSSNNVNQICRDNYDRYDVLVAHAYCDKFYKCAHGEPVVYDCPDSLLYDIVTERCQWPHEVDCGDRPISEGNGNDDDNDSEVDDGSESPGGGGNCDPSEAPAICAADNSDGIMVAHENCDQFYICLGGKPVALQCPANTVFNPNNDQCDWPRNVDCGDRVIPDPVPNPPPVTSTPGEPEDTTTVRTTPGDTTPGDNCDPSEAPAICAAENSDGILVAHENCNQFYMCSGGKPVAMSCPGNLLFNPSKDQCDWPSNVDCGDRVIPDPDTGNTPGEPEDVTPTARPPGTCNCNPEEAPAICAADDSSGVLVAHENCNQFYKCDHGKPVVFTCLEGLLYNPYIEQCDWPENVDCGDRVIPDPVPEPSPVTPTPGEPEDTTTVRTTPGDTTPGDNCDPSEAPAICAAENSDGVLVAHENCNQFYICSGGKPVAMSCPGNLLFNPSKDQCDWPSNVDCGDRVIPDPDTGNTPGEPEDVTPTARPPGTCNCNPEEAPAICAADDSSGVLVAHENCNQFYKCDHGKPVVFTCNEGLLYNPYIEQCDWPENVDCGDRVIPDPVPEPSPVTPTPGEPEDTTTVRTTPGDTTPGDNCDPSEAPAICAAENSDGILVAHENCNQFYICSGGKPVAMSCPGNLLFNPSKDQCDWPSNVDCGDRVIPDPDTGNTPGEPEDVTPTARPPGTCNCNPEEAPAICAADDSSGVLVAHENCNQFYKCDHGKPVVFTCSEGLLYNPYIEQCDWPENVDCGDRVIPDPVPEPSPVTPTPGEPEDTTTVRTTPGDTTPGDNCDPSEAPAICAAENSDGILVAHENCNQFYICSGGKPVAMSCPGNLLFNPSKDQCDWPSNVDCGDRVIPDPDTGNTPGEPEDVTPTARPPGTCNCNPEEAPAICAAEDSSGVLVAHENCNQFYKCDHGKPVVFTCNEGLLYNPYIEQCDWPENVDCGDRVIPDPVPEPSPVTPTPGEPEDTTTIRTTPGDTTPGDNCDPSEAPAICAAENSDGVLVAHENCNQFYICSGGKPVAMSCPGNLLFNPSKDQCDWPSNVDCGDRVIPDPDTGNTPGEPEDVTPTARPPGTCNCNPEEAPAICAAEDSSGVLVAHENCNQFYKCDHGKPVVLTCHGVLLYNPYTEQCDWPENVDCGDRVIPDPEDIEPAPVSTTPDGSGNTTPGGTTPGDTTPGNNCDPSEAPAICAAENSEGVLVANENCNQFYVCSGGKPVAMSCPGNLLFNPSKDQCDWASNVDCGDRVIPDGSNETNPDTTTPGGTNPGNNCDPSEAPTICAAENSEGVLVAHENCDQFYICLGGKPLALDCPPGLLFNPKTDQCDWPDNVDCADRAIPGDVVVPPPPPVEDNNETEDCSDGVADHCACNPKNAPALCAQPESNGKLIAHESCDQFYLCSNLVPIAISCPAGLFYNIDTELCDWASNVKCGDRIVGYANVYNPSDASAECAQPGSHGKLIAHANCNQFYLCSNLVAVELSCADGLVFNVDSGFCDWPSNVNCDDRVQSFAALNKHWQSRQTVRN